LPPLGQMNHTFNTCSALTELDFSGTDPSELTKLDYTFSNCSALKTICGDSSWRVPSSVSSGQTFYKATALVGGNGTKYSDSKTSSLYFRIDREGSPGYMALKP